MANIYYQQDCDLNKLNGKTVAIIGYGSQGHAHALNLKDSGVNVIVGLYNGSKSWAKAEAQGLKVMVAAEAAKVADIIMILINDEKQAKLYNVKKVEVLEDSTCIKRELMLIKIYNKPENRSDVHFAVDTYRAKVVDYTTEGMCIEVTGDPMKIDAFVELMKPFGIIEICRTGIVALERGTTSLLNK